MNALGALGIPYDVCPGVSSFQAAAAALKTELTAPEVSQTIMLTRTTARTPLPEEQELGRIARTHATLAAHYAADCPAAVIHRASWLEEEIVI